MAQGRTADMKTLMNAVIVPLIEHRNADGRRSYAALLLSLDQGEEGRQVWMKLAGFSPLTDKLFKLMQAIAIHVPPAVFRERCTAAIVMVLASVVRAERLGERLPMDLLTDDLMSGAVALLTAPVSQGMAKAAAETSPQALRTA